MPVKVTIDIIPQIRDMAREVVARSGRRLRHLRYCDLRLEVDRDPRSQYLFVQRGDDMVPPVGVHPLPHGGDGELVAEDTLMDAHSEEL